MNRASPGHPTENPTPPHTPTAPAAAPHALHAPATSGVSRIRVRYSECDPMGVAHHASYAPWLEIARTELLRSSGVSYGQLEEAGVFLVITRLEIRYRRAVRYDDVVDVCVKVVGGGHVKIEHEYEIILAERTPGTPGAIAAANEDVGQVLAVASTTLACVNRAGAVSALPEWLRGSKSGARA